MKDKMDRIYLLFILENFYTFAQLLLAFFITNLIYKKNNRYQIKLNLRENRNWTFYKNLRYINLIIIFLSIDYLLSQFKFNYLNNSIWISMMVFTPFIFIVALSLIRKR